MITRMGSRIASPELIGREAELEAISIALDQATAGQGRTVLIGGEAGVGKSRLLAVALQRARAGGAIVLQGGCVGLADGALPFAPIVEAIRPLLNAANRPERRASEAVVEIASDGRRSGERAPAARDDRFVSSWGEDVDEALLGVAAELGLLARHRAADAAAELRPDWARTQLYETFLGLLRRLAADSPLVLAIEDVHWAGDSTRELLAFLVRNTRAERLLLLVTFRSDELHRRHPLLFWLGEADRSPGVERLELARLGRPAMVRQLAGILGREPDPTLADSIFFRSEGNPFFAEELLAAGADSGPLPPTLREVLAARLAHVSEPTLRLLGVAAIVGRRVDHDLLARVSELTERELDDAVGEALAAQLLVVDEEAPTERYAFRHALLAEAAAETVLPGRRRRLHAAIAQALTESSGLRGAEEAGHLVEIAHHWFEAREIEHAFTAALVAGDAALGSGAYAEALRQYERTAELWDIVPDRAAEAEIDRLDLLRRTAHAAQLSGEYGRAAQLLREGSGQAHDRGDRVVEGLLYERLGRTLWTSADFGGAEDAYERAVELVPEEPPTADRARVLAGYAQVLMLSSHLTRSLEVGKRALDLARQAGSRQLEGHVLSTIGAVVALLGDTEAGAAMTGEAIEIAEEVHDLDDIGRGYANHATVLDAGGHREQSTSVALKGAARLRELGMGTTYAAFNLMNAADGLIGLGRWDEAFSLAAEVQPIARGTSRVFATQQLAYLQAMRGEFESAARTLAELTRTMGQSIEAQFNGSIAATQISLAMLTGDTAAGRQVSDRALAILAQTEHRVLRGRVLGLAIRLEADSGERARAARDAAALDVAVVRAGSHLEAVRGLADGMPPSVGRANVLQSIAFAEAEATRLDAASDPARWRAALEMARARGPFYDAAYASYRLAEALLPDRARREEAAALLSQANEAAARLGARPLQEAIQALGARARITLAPVAPATPPAAAPDAEAAARDGAAPDVASDAGAAYGLSEREIEVLRLLAAGRTNRQIGQALFISESTAGVHVSHILAKLGVAGRVEAATIAARLGLTAA
jgi:ATP/maltotriose-dependent transcriptional regulator MalT